MVCLAQIVHQSWVKISIIFEQIKMSFHLSLITKEFHRLCPKWLLNLWYVWRKSWTYLESRFTLSPNRPKWASTWASSPRSTIGCIQNDFWPYGSYDANHAPILHRCKLYLQTDQNKIPYDQCQLGVLSGACKMISERRVRSVQTVHLSCIKIGTISKRTKTSFHLSSSPRSTIGCVQNDFRAYVRLVQTVHLSSVKVGTISK
jgi:hypothetical protein